MVKRRHVSDLYQRSSNPRAFRASVKDSKDLLVRLELQKKLSVHSGCVNTISWNDTGTLILSGSDDHRLVVADPFSYATKAVVNTPHTANIFSAKFVPESCDRKLVSCAGDGVIVYTDLDTQQSDSIHCHSGTVYDLLTVPGDPHSLLSCGEDGTVRWFDSRLRPPQEGKEDVMIQCSGGVSSMDLHPLFNYQLALGCSDSCVRLYDRRMLDTRGSAGDKQTGLAGLFSKFSAPGLQGRTRRITSVQFRPDGAEVLASYSSDYLYIFDPKEDETKGRKLKVGRPSRTKLSRNSALRGGSQPVKKLRLRGDWSDTGPNSRPGTEVEEGEGTNSAGDQASGQAALMQRMTFALSRMLNDPGTRLAMERLTTADPPDHTNTQSDQRNQIQVSRVQPAMEPSRTSAAASAIQESWRRYRERKMEERRQTYIQISEGGEPSIVTNNAQDDIRQQPPADDVDLYGAENPTVVVDDRPLESRNDVNDQTRNDASEQSRNDASEQSRNDASDQTRNDASDQSRNDASEQSRNDVNLKSQADTQSGSADCQERAGNDCSYDDKMNYAGLPPGPSRDPGEDEPVDAHDEDMEDLRTSFSHLRDSGLEPTLNLRYSSKGSDSSSIEINPEALPGPCRVVADIAEAQPGPSCVMADISEALPGPSCVAADISEALPGPSRVVTDPGRVGVDPITGIRRRRHGVSSVPTSSILPDDNPNMLFSQHNSVEVDDEDEGIVEYSDDEGLDSEDEDGGRSSRIIQPPVRQKFIGHRNVRTMMKEASWWGNNYVLSGSDCGHFFAWDRATAEVVLIKEADRHVVNCVRPHPTLPILATAGIDYDVKIWAPTAPESTFDPEQVEVVVRRNELMLEETRDTITVPASLMIRMLASLNQIRRGGQS